jgi:hypothetical protein
MAGMHHAGSVDQNEDTQTSTWISVDQRDGYERDRAVNLLDKKLGIDIRDLPPSASHQQVKDRVLGALAAAGVPRETVEHFADELTRDLAAFPYPRS